MIAVDAVEIELTVNAISARLAALAPDMPRCAEFDRALLLDLMFRDLGRRVAARGRFLITRRLLEAARRELLAVLREATVHETIAIATKGSA